MQTVRDECIALHCCDCLLDLQDRLPLLKGLLEHTKLLPFVTSRPARCVVTRELQVEPVCTACITLERLVLSSRSAALPDLSRQGQLMTRNFRYHAADYFWVMSITQLTGFGASHLKLFQAMSRVSQRCDNLLRDAKEDTECASNCICLFRYNAAYNCSKWHLLQMGWVP